MLYREIIAVCSQMHTKHINALCGHNVEFLNVKLVVHLVTIGLYVNGLDTIPSLLDVTETNYYNCGETRPPVENSTCHLRKTKQGYYPPYFKGKFGSTVYSATCFGHIWLSSG